VLDLLDELAGGGLGECAERARGCLRRQVSAGDLQAVEQQAGAARVELVGGDALQDLADGELDGGAVFGHGQGEVGAAGGARGHLRGRDRRTRGVVEVAERLAAQAGAAAARAADVDVAAAEAGFWRGFWRGWGRRRGGWGEGFGCGLDAALHGGLPWGVFP